MATKIQIRYKLIPLAPSFIFAASDVSSYSWGTHTYTINTSTLETNSKLMYQLVV